MDSLALHASLADRGIPVENPAEFSRPVVLPDGTHDAAFRVVRLGSQLIPNGRVFFCHHFTPELVWRNEWRRHPNGASSIVEFVIATDEPSRTADLYRAIFGSDAITEVLGGHALEAGQATILFLTSAEIARRFSGLAPTSLNDADRMAALTFRTRSLSLVESALEAGHVSNILREPDRIIVPECQAGGVALAFVE
jgi:hypothetical protein